MKVSGAFDAVFADGARSIREGDLFAVKVTTRSGVDGLFLRGSGITFFAPVSAALKPGRIVTVKVLATVPSIRLAVVSGKESQSAAGVADRLSSIQPSGTAPSVDSIPTIVLQAAAIRGQSQDTGIASFAILLYRRLFGEPRRGERSEIRRFRARGVLELAARGLLQRKSPMPLTPVRELLRWMAGNATSESGTDRAGTLQESSPQTEESRPEAFAPPGELERYLQRSVVTPDHLLQLYNALRPETAIHWFLIPIRGWSVSDREVSAVLKVGWHIESRRPVEAVLSVDAGHQNTWWFHWKMIGTKPRDGIELVGAGGAVEPVSDQLLARLGFPGHTGGAGKTVQSDGFSFGPFPTGALWGVDTYG